MRFTESGALDTTFSTTGVVRTPFGTNSVLSRSVAMQNGKLVAAGCTPLYNTSDFALARYELTTQPTVVSRKAHGASGAMFELNLPFTGSAAIEPRNGIREHQIVFSFPSAVTYTGASVTAAAGKSAQVKNSMLTADGRNVAVNLTNVTNAQTLTITLTGVTTATVRAT